MSVALAIKKNRGWQAELSLTFAKRANKTAMVNSKHIGPLRVQRPFYPEDDVCHVYMLHPPGGVVGGDSLQIDINVQQHAHALLTTPGATKFYLSSGEFAVVEQNLNIETNASLEWFPQENILFPGAKTKINTQINLASNSRFLGWEINCLGRPVNKEIFDHGQMDSLLSIYQDQKPLLIERQRVMKQQDLSSSAGLRNFPMNAIFIATPCTEHHLEIALNTIATLNSEIPIGVTLLDNLLVLRALGYTTEQLQKLIIPVWQALRPLITDKEAITPRIWAT